VAVGWPAAAADSLKKYAAPVYLTHSSDLRTMQEIFHVAPPFASFLGDAVNATDLSDLFQPGAVPKH
jgi:phosphatidylinositol-3-phosphatase